MEAESEAHLAEKTNVKDNKKWKNGELGRCEEILRSVEAHARKFSVLKLAEILGKVNHYYKYFIITAAIRLICLFY